MESAGRSASRADRGGRKIVEKIREEQEKADAKVRSDGEERFIGKDAKKL